MVKYGERGTGSKTKTHLGVSRKKRRAAATKSYMEASSILNSFAN